MIASVLVIGASALLPIRAHAISQQVHVGFTNVAFQTCINGTASCGGPDSFGFVNPSITVEYRAVAKHADTGLPIQPGETVRTGERVTFECSPSSDSDISWFSPGSVFDSPYGVWRSSSFSGPSCTDRWYVGTDIGGGADGKVYAALALNAPARSVTPGAGFTSCTTLPDACSKTCTATTPGTTETAFSIGNTSAQFFGQLLVTDAGSRPQLAGKCLGSTTRPLGSRQLSAQKISIITDKGDSQNYRLQASFQGAFGNGKSRDTDIPIPDTVIRFPISVSDAAVVNTGTSGTPSTPVLSASAGASCRVGNPHLLSMSATSPDSHPLRYLIDWDADGTVDELVPPNGSYVASGVAQSASRTFATAGHKTVQVRAQDDRSLLSAWASLSFDCSGPADASVDDDSLDGTTGTVGTAGESATADLELRALPSLVRSGQSTKLSWSARNVSSCVLEGTNRDRWEALSSRIGGEESSPIRQQTVYTLTCFTGTQTLRKSVTVNVIPGFQER